MLRLALVTDLEGTLEPCGCTSRPAGGVDRLAFALAKLRRDPVPTLRIATGQLFAQANGRDANARAHTQDLWKRQALGAILTRLNPDVIAPQPSDFTQALAQLQSLSRERKQPLLARLPSTEVEKVRTSTVLSVGGTNVAVVIAPDENEVKRLRAAGAKVVIALAHGTEEGRTARTSTADLIVRTGANAPERHAAIDHRTLHLSGGRHGERLLVVDLWPRNATPQHFRLVENLTADPPGAEALAIAQQHILDHTAPRDPSIRTLLDQLFARINAHHASAGAEPRDVQAGQAGYAGSRTCAACHTQAYFWWRQTSHGRAFDTLISRGRELDLDCIGCHVTGYEQPGGASLSALDELKGVGCESCHGPGTLHVENPRDARINVRREVPAETCVSCHDPEHSDSFVYAKARSALIVTAHGNAAPK